MTTNSPTTRTTLWDEAALAEASAAQPRGTRGAWRAPTGSAARRAPAQPQQQARLPGLDEARSTADGFDEEAEEEAQPEERRRTPRKRATPRTPTYTPSYETAAISGGRWWWPQSRAGRVVLAVGILLAGGFVTATGIVVHQFLLRNNHFRIAGSANVESAGLTQVNREELLSVFGQDIGRNIFFVPLGERRRELEAIPWVRQATVMRVLPDRILVKVVERTPIAFVRTGDQVELADAEGVLLPMSAARMARHHYSFPVLTGLDANPAGGRDAGSRRERMALYERFVTALDSYQAHASEQVSEMDVSDVEDLRATLPSGGSDVLAHFGADQFLPRYQMYQSHIAEWRARYPRLIGVDLRFAGEVPLEMAPAEPAAKPAATALAGAKPVSASVPASVPANRQPAKPTAKSLTKPTTSVPRTGARVSGGVKSGVRGHRARVISAARGRHASPHGAQRAVPTSAEAAKTRRLERAGSGTKSAEGGAQ